DARRGARAGFGRRLAHRRRRGQQADRHGRPLGRGARARRARVRLTRTVEPPAAFLERLRTLCAIDSRTGDLEGVDRCARLLAEWCAKAGCETELVEQPAGLHLIARLEGGLPRTLLVGHHDTVFEAGTAARRPLRVDGGRVLGPGVADMKGGLLV